MTWILALAFIAAADAPPSFDAFFADFAKKRDAIQVLDARFTQQNVTQEETVASEGSIVYVKPRRIVFRYEKPNAGATYAIEGQKAYEYEPDIKQLQIYNLEDKAQAEIFFLGFDNDTDALRKDYDVTVFDSNDKPLGSHGIIIHPKKKADGESSNFREVRLFLRDADYLPYHIHIENDDNSQVDILIRDFAINGKLDPAKTKIFLPEGTKVIDNDEVAETVGLGGKSVPSGDVVTVEPLVEPQKKETPAR